MELFTTIAFAVGVVVLLAVFAATVYIINSDAFGDSRPTKPSVAPVAQHSPDSAPRELVNV